jgi:hypothetical protein
MRDQQANGCNALSRYSFSAACAVEQALSLLLAPFGSFNEITKLLSQCLSHKLIVPMTFGFQLLLDFPDRRALP